MAGLFFFLFLMRKELKMNLLLCIKTKKKESCKAKPQLFTEKKRKNKLFLLFLVKYQKKFLALHPDINRIIKTDKK
jgi:hypothetical protein